MINQNLLNKAVYDWFYNGDNSLYSIYYIIGEYGDDGNAKQDASSIILSPQTVGKSTTLTAYLESCEMLYTFTIQQYVPLSIVKNKDINITALEFFESLAKWVEDNTTSPAFPETCSISKIEVLAGNIAGVDQNGAKLQISVQIYYTEQGV